LVLLLRACPFLVVSHPQAVWALNAVVLFRSSPLNFAVLFSLFLSNLQSPRYGPLLLPLPLRPDWGLKFQLFLLVSPPLGVLPAPRTRCHRFFPLFRPNSPNTFFFCTLYPVLVFPLDFFFIWTSTIVFPLGLMVGCGGDFRSLLIC